MRATYLEQLTDAGIGWGFFSGATTGSARYVLEKRLGLQSPVLVAMEDAPGKPNPIGLLQTVERLEQPGSKVPIIYVGDTVADMYTVENARQQCPDRRWVGVGVLPPHVQDTAEQSQTYAATLQKAGAKVVFNNVEELTPVQIRKLVTE
ncbi:HAD-IA family hydrolase [Kovacikia minuta CCNUW1]|uniref:HAD family hydrolase n=1 Tax=Kovacikia minuta TaxID=2931930 RepID=UPI001CCA08EC|nr:HAD-IA family hydrolase [Kovacikia minuta CCNUW1]